MILFFGVQCNISSCTRTVNVRCAFLAFGHMQYHVCLQNNQTIHCWEGDIRLLHTSSGPTSSQFDTSGFEKPVAFGKVSGNPKLHCELRYFHNAGSLSASCQER